MASTYDNASLEIGFGPPNHYEDPVVVAARSVYHEYSKVHHEFPEEPLGVAVNLHTLRGQIMFSDQPILLPYESFVPVGQLLEAEDAYPEPELDMVGWTGHSE